MHDGCTYMSDWKPERRRRSVARSLLQNPNDSQVSKTRLRLDHMRPGGFQDQIVRLPESTPSSRPCVTDGRSRRLKGQCGSQRLGPRRIGDRLPKQSTYRRLHRVVSNRCFQRSPGFEFIAEDISPGRIRRRRCCARRLPSEQPQRRPPSALPLRPPTAGGPPRAPERRS